MRLLSKSNLQKCGRQLCQRSWETCFPSTEDHRRRLKVIVMLYTCHVREVCFNGPKYQPRWLRTPVSAKSNWGVFECGIEWYCSVLLGAMYAGILILSIGHSFCCERSPCTAAFWLWNFDFSPYLKLKSKLNCFNWLASAKNIGTTS